MYFTDVTATIVTSGQVSKLAVQSGATSADVLTFVDIDFINAYPAQFAVFPDGLWVNGTQIVDGQNITVTVPTTGVLAPVGPVTMGSAGQDASIFIGALTAEIYLHTNSSVIGPLNITCAASNTSIILGTINVEGEPDSTPYAPANGFKPDFPDLPSNGEFGFYRVNYDCSIGDKSGMPLDLIFGGFLEGSYPAGSDFSFDNITSFLTLNQGLLSSLREEYGAASLETIIDTIDIGLTNASPSPLNVLKTPITIDATFPDTGDLVLAIPQTGSLDAGPFTASADAAGQYMLLSLGDTTASLTLLDDGGCEIDTLPVTCSPYGVLDLYS